MVKQPRFRLSYGTVFGIIGCVALTIGLFIPWKMVITDGCISEPQAPIDSAGSIILIAIAITIPILLALNSPLIAFFASLLNFFFTFFVILLISGMVSCETFYFGGIGVFLGLFGSLLSISASIKDVLNKYKTAPK